MMRFWDQPMYALERPAILDPATPQYDSWVQLLSESTPRYPELVGSLQPTAGPA